MSPCNRRYYYLSSMVFLPDFAGFFALFAGEGVNNKARSISCDEQARLQTPGKTDLMDILSFPVRRHGKHLSAESSKNEYCFFFTAIYAKLIKWHFGHEEEGEQIGQTVMPHEKAKFFAPPLAQNPIHLNPQR